MAEASNGILLDTSVIIAHMRGKIDMLALKEPHVLLFMSLVVFGELLKGALKADHPARQHAKIHEVLKHAGVLYPDDATAHFYARTACELDAKGTPIPENDVWIAAVALEMNMPLATRDAHFDRVDGLKILNW